MAIKSYKVLSHLQHDGKQYAPKGSKIRSKDNKDLPSTVEMDEAEAATIPHAVELIGATDVKTEPAKK